MDFQFDDDDDDDDGWGLVPTAFTSYVNMGS